MADLTDANLFELAHGSVSVTYSTSSFAGPPQFSYHDGERELNASGDEISTGSTDLGTEVSVLLEAVPDRHTVTVTLLVPAVNVAEGADAAVSTVLIETTARTSIGGPALVDGQLQTYRVTELTGTARAVRF